jgi:RNA polymerase-binding transcription factor DksA
MSAVDERVPELRAALEQQRQFRIAQLTEMDHQPTDGRNARSAAPSDDVTHALRNGARFALTEIEAALARMDSGRYGICETCAKAIAVERLEILPMAALCLRCQQVRDTKWRW